jgi:ABC-type glycerol-3-phosphate transport system permease component
LPFGDSVVVAAEALEEEGARGLAEHRERLDELIVVLRHAGIVLDRVLVVPLILADSALAIPFAILILRAFILTLPPSIMEAARVDGAGPIRVFVSVVLPVSRVNDWSAAMATAVMASVSAIVLLVIAQKYIAAGTTAGAIK